MLLYSPVYMGAGTKIKALHAKKKITLLEATKPYAHECNPTQKKTQRSVYGLRKPYRTKNNFRVLSDLRLWCKIDTFHFAHFSTCSRCGMAFWSFPYSYMTLLGAKNAGFYYHARNWPHIVFFYLFSFFSFVILHTALKLLGKVQSYKMVWHVGK